MDEVPRHSGGVESAAKNGGIFRLEELSYTQVEALDRARVVVLFSVSPLEEHGPHLPVGTDLLTSGAICAKLAERILESKPGWTVLIGPSIPIGASAFDSAGTLLARARTVRNVTLDYGTSLARHGFRYILVLNGHGGLCHIVALEEAAAVVSRRYRVRMISVSGPVLLQFMRGRYAHRLEDSLGRPFTAVEREALDGDTHAGMWETSLVLLNRPDLVKATYRQLAAQKFTRINIIRRNYPLQLGNRMGYIGTPSAACKELGEAAQRLFLEVVWEVVQPVLDSHNRKWRQTSFLYKIPFLRTAFPRLAVAAAAGLAVWALVQWFY